MLLTLIKDSYTTFIDRTGTVSLRIKVRKRDRHLIYFRLSVCVVKLFQREVDESIGNGAKGFVGAASRMRIAS